MAGRRRRRMKCTEGERAGEKADVACFWQKSERRRRRRKRRGGGAHDVKWQPRATQ
jgi:hypothetical protein